MAETANDNRVFNSSGRSLNLLDDPDTLLDQAETYEFTGIPPATLSQLRWRRKGPPFVKCGARVYYRVADLRAWIHENTHKVS